MQNPIGKNKMLTKLLRFSLLVSFFNHEQMFPFYTQYFACLHKLNPVFELKMKIFLEFPQFFTLLEGISYIYPSYQFLNWSKKCHAHNTYWNFSERFESHFVPLIRSRTADLGLYLQKTSSNFSSLFRRGISITLIHRYQKT